VTSQLTGPARSGVSGKAAHPAFVVLPAVAAVAVLFLGSVRVGLSACAAVAVLAVLWRRVGTARANRVVRIWQALDDVGRDLALLEPAALRVRAASAAVEIFGAGYAHLYLTDLTGQVVRATRCTATGIVHDEPASEYSRPRTGDRIVDVALEPAAGYSCGLLRLGLGPDQSQDEPTKRALLAYSRIVARHLQRVQSYGQVRREESLPREELELDPVTGLASRAAFISATEAALAAASDGHGEPAVILVHLGNVAQLAATLGPERRDGLVRGAAAVAAEIAGELGALVVARLRSADFGILLPTCTGLLLPEVAQEVQASMPASVEGVEIGAVTGSARFLRADDTVIDLLHAADLEVQREVRQHQLSRAGSGRRASRAAAQAEADVATAAELRRALDVGEFVVFFQPQVNFDWNLVVGAEALTRWQHPTRGLLAPADFLDGIDRLGLTHEFTLLVLDRALAASAEWSRGWAANPVSINLSAAGLADRGLPSAIAERVVRYGMPADRLVVEINERLIDPADAGVVNALAELRGAGVQLSVDGFTGGSCSVADLDHLGVTELKIARTLTGALNGEGDAAAAVRSTVDLAHGFGMRVIAEGVESRTQVAQLIELGCDVAQGWHFGKPAPASALLDPPIGLT
jgi:EAL domain-containing protein (putative c-di-GMP-specific phosphodiesterase class I)/GGDEF domain-containing protein